MRILIFGLPGSGKTTLAKPFSDLIGGIHIQEDRIDNSVEGHKEQALKIKHMCQGVELTGKIAVADFTCPLENSRYIFDADYTVFMDTIKETDDESLNELFQQPMMCDYHVAQWFNDTHTQLVEVVTSYMERNNA